MARTVIVVLDYVNWHEAHIGGCARIHTAVDTCSQVLLWISNDEV